MVKISALPNAGALTGTEVVPLVKSATTDKTTTQAIANLGGGVHSVVAGTNVTVNSTDPANPIVSSTGGGGSVATDVIWDNKGDLAVGTGADTAAVLPVGANGQAVVADSTTPTGLKYTALLVTSLLTTRVQTGNGDTLLLADSGLDHMVEYSDSSDPTVAVTVPTNATTAFPVGTQINLLATGTAQVVVAGAGGVTVNGTPGLKLRAQWSAATIVKRATNTWVLFGDLSA